MLRTTLSNHMKEISVTEDHVSSKQIYNDLTYCGYYLANL